LLAPSPHPPTPHHPPAGSASLRARLHHLVTPLLRVVLALLAALPSGAAAREQALAFVGDHSRTLLRVMHDAASPGVRWVGVGGGEQGGCMRCEW
jgi:hypothetical protein